jgi:YegS/Rv2252/BmrU family lipid kinase
VNPKAGKRNPYEGEFSVIENRFRERGIPYSVRFTEHPKHATEIVREEAASGEPVRVIAVGGDGTLCEVANGAMHLPNVEVGLVPCGSGNDYLRIYGEKEDFMDPDRLIDGEAVAVDMIDNAYLPSINICSCGIDSDVAMGMKHYKTLPFVSGPMAYNLALVKAFLGKLGHHMKITVDGKVVGDERYLIAVVANAMYYGGGYCASPESKVNDGILDIILIRVPKSRFQIPKLLKYYKAGVHLHHKEFEPLLTYLHGERITIETDEEVAVNSDGECALMKSISYQVDKHALRFILPKGCKKSVLDETEIG